MLHKITAILLLLAFVALLVVLSGCTVTEVTSPSGWKYRSTRLLNNAGVDELTVDQQTGTVSLKGVKSDSSKGLDVALEALRKVP